MTGEFGQLASEQDTNVASKTLLPVEPRHWAGRALVLRSPQTGRLACAALQPPGAPVNTYAARFQGPPVAGTLFLRLWPSFASVYAELHWTNGTRRDAQLRWSVRKIGKQPGALLQQPAHGSEGPAGNPAPGNLEHVTPPNVPPVPQTPGSKPPVEKPCYTPPDSCSHVTVGKRPGTLGTRTYHVIEGAVPPLRDCGADEQLEVSLVDVSTGEPLAAGALLVWSPRHAVASLGPRHGKAIFHQTSPFEPTLAVVKLDSLDYVASQLLITPISIGSADTLCPGPTAPYNPAKVDRAASPPEGFGSDDQFPVGDLSGKYGPLSGLRSFHRHLLDATLPLSGPESIVGRMLLVRGTDGRPLVCANVLPVFNGDLIRARSTFTGPLRGSITITRAKQAEDPFGDAYVDLGLCWQDGRNSTVDHNWHVHSVALAPGSSDCAATKGHYNPHHVDTGRAYGCECSSKAPLRCEAGDLAGRQGAVSIPSCHVGIARYHFADSHVALNGPTSVVGLPIVFHAPHFEMPRVACANLVLL